MATNLARNARNSQEADGERRRISIGSFLQQAHEDNVVMFRDSAVCRTALDILRQRGAEAVGWLENASGTPDTMLGRMRRTCSGRSLVTANWDRTRQRLPLNLLRWRPDPGSVEMPHQPRLRQKLDTPVLTIGATQVSSFAHRVSGKLEPGADSDDGSRHPTPIPNAPACSTVGACASGRSGSFQNAAYVDRYPASRSICVRYGAIPGIF